MVSRISIAAAVSALCLSTTALGQWSDGFEYADGPLVGNGNWEIWYSGGSDGTVTSQRSHSGAKSLRLDHFSDCVQRYNIDGGQWVFTAWTYMPNDAVSIDGVTADGYLILMNQYGGPDNWSMQVRFGFMDGLVESQFGAQTLPLVIDQWVEFRAEIDLDADLMDLYYGGQPLAQGLLWSDNVSGAGLPQIRALDLYSSTVDGFFVDDVSLNPAAPPCPGDLDGDGDVDLSDLATLLSNFGTTGTATPEQGDSDGDLDVDLTDLAVLLGGFGSTC
ncbi:MAG: hypothetical protein IT450_15385 [Phycisphaerales bacterium]|nr:hypothetical protein [Phycisphaerales bacterium]